LDSWKGEINPRCIAFGTKPHANGENKDFNNSRKDECYGALVGPILFKGYPKIKVAL